METLSIIITAGGIGKRMGSTIPKQFLLLKNRPVLMHTLERFHTFAPKAQFILTLPEEWTAEWNSLCAKYDCKVSHKIVSGGKERFHSVKNALRFCEGDAILIHDGVRPLFSQATFENAVSSLATNVAAVPTCDINDSLRHVGKENNVAVNRAEYKIVQTPQAFRKAELLEAYQVDFSSEFTDDASVMEKAGFGIGLFAGNLENLKITQQSDLDLAEFLLKKS